MTSTRLNSNTFIFHAIGRCFVITRSFPDSEWELFELDPVGNRLHRAQFCSFSCAKSALYDFVSAQILILQLN
jgi:hypothetical protein